MQQDLSYENKNMVQRAFPFHRINDTPDQLTTAYHSFKQNNGMQRCENEY